MSAKTSNPGSKLAMPTDLTLRGETPVAQKNTCAATQIERAGAVVLNRSLWNSSFLRCNQREMIKPSSVTVIVPAAVPNSKTEAKTNVSDTEIVAGIDGSRTVIDPLRSVSAASKNHRGLTGEANSSKTAWAITIRPTHTTTEM